MLIASVFMTGFLWWKIGSSSEYRGTGSVERFEEFTEVQEGKDVDDKSKDLDVQPNEVPVEVRGVELDSEGRQKD
jgi:hypothetical protein